MFQSYVPIDDVPSAFTSLCDEIPSELCIDEFIAYVSSTWVRKDLPLDAVHASLSRYYFNLKLGKHLRALQSCHFGFFIIFIIISYYYAGKFRGKN